MVQRRHNQNDDALCSRASALSCILLVIIVLGVFPYTYIQRDIENRKSLEEIAKSLRSLENEHKDLVNMLNNMETDLDKRGAVAALHSSSQTNSEQQSHQVLTTSKVSNTILPGKPVLVPGVVTERPQQIVPEARDTEPVEVAAFHSLPQSGSSSGLITFGTSSLSSSKSVLVVGGTDGSGTRRVVQILTQLGVTMVSEDPETYDIHADIVGGWPPVVSPVIQAAKTLDYDPDKLPVDIRSKISDSLTKLLKLAESDSSKPTSYVLAKGGALPRPAKLSVKGIKFGFKAPVAMTLAPYWAYLLPNFRLLHVVRDGRDIAFSANQGPVEKFWDSMYGPRRHRPEVKAIKLWSDWNTQLKTWAQKHVKDIEGDKRKYGTKAFGYYALHTEDLVDEDRHVRFAAIANLAAWVGSDISDRELCCLALRGAAFMGSHDRTPKNEVGANKVSKRYGEWKARLQMDADLKTELMREGSAGLREFGYEPERVKPTTSAEGKTCDLQPSDCGILRVDVAAGNPDVNSNNGGVLNGEAPQVPLIPALWAVNGICRPAAGVDYKGADLSSFTMRLADGSLDMQSCCRRCQETPGCKHYTIDTTSSLCYMKSSMGVLTKTDQTTHLISGDII